MSPEQKRYGQDRCFVVDGDLPLAHRFQKGGMRSGGGAIDFVRQDDLVENRSLLEFETSTHGIVNIDPDDIGGNEVESELNTFERAAERLHERFGE